MRRLMEYLPPFLHNVQEYQALFTSFQGDLDNLSADLRKARNSQFILTADSEALKRYERYLGIADDGSTLEARRHRVLTRWNSTPVYTLPALRDRISALQGNNDFKATVDPIKLHLDIAVKIGEEGLIEELERTLGFMVPANLTLEASNALEAKPTAGDLNLASSSVFTRQVAMTDAYQDGAAVSSWIGGLGAGGTFSSSSQTTDAGQSSAQTSGQWATGASASNTSLICAQEAFRVSETLAGSAELAGSLTYATAISASDAFETSVATEDIRPLRAGISHVTVNEI